MARQLTPEALRFIQHHHFTLPDSEAYEGAETIIDAPPLCIPPLPDAAVARREEADPVDAWLRRGESGVAIYPGSNEPVIEAEEAGWLALVLAALRRWLAWG
jgi:hypothetical protein